MITAYDVVNKRLFELASESNSLVLERKRLTEEYEAAMSRIEQRQQEIEVESHIFESYNDCGVVVTTTTTTTVSVGRKSKADRLMIEDAVKSIIDHHGGIVTDIDLINGLRRFSFVWSKDKLAMNYIMKSGMVENIHDNFYQLRRTH